MGRYGFTGRHGMTRPDEKMGGEAHGRWWVETLTSPMNGVLKKRANKKRRQRDRDVRWKERE